MSIKKSLGNLYRNITGKNYYKKIYPPIYNQAVALPSDYPIVYNKFGQPMEFFFIRDAHTAHTPYGSKSNFFIWDRYNIGLDYQFYSHNSMMERVSGRGGGTKHFYGMLIESEIITPDDYLLFDKHKQLASEFEAIFTYSSKILNKLDNAVFMPFNATLSYGTKEQGGVLSSKTYELKSKNISIIASNKLLCEMHHFRKAIAEKCKTYNLADTFGTFDGGPRVPQIADVLTHYRYNIAIENFIDDYYFTEKILNCFASMTVPIYCGAPKIADFFNSDGIIFIKQNDLDNLEKILKQCTKEDYEQRLPAIKENYEKALEYVNIDDMLYKKVKELQSKRG